MDKRSLKAGPPITLFLEGPRLKLRSDLAMDCYIDESSQTGHKYLVLGSLAIFTSKVEGACDRLKAARDEHNHTGELCWTKVSNYKFGTYVDWIKVFGSLARARQARFTALVLRADQQDHARWNEGDSELGFNKLIYQLLLHRVGCRYGREWPINGYLDSRTTKHHPEEMRKMLNAALARDHGIRTSPFRRMHFRDSKESDLIQLTDILTGAVAFHFNGHARKPDTRPAKTLLCESIRTLHNQGYVRSQFDIWPFRFRSKSQGPRR
jgi:hypothetical protein